MLAEYVRSKCKTEQMANKALWFCDIFHYLANGEPITEAKYTRGHDGIVPDNGVDRSIDYSEYGVNEVISTLDDLEQDYQSLLNLVDIGQCMPFSAIDWDKKELIEIIVLPLSKKKANKFFQQMSALRDKQKAKPRRKKTLINPVPNPRYDDVYYNGLKWLDSL